VRLYITVWEDAESDRADGLSYHFSGTQADQKGLVRSINKDGVARGDTILRAEEIEVPTDKAGLLAFLNTYRLRPDEDEANNYHADRFMQAERLCTAEEGKLL
jgi:hypothetical protein